MSNSKTIELPAREEMERRLLAVSSDENLHRKFYPILLRYAEMNLSPSSIAMIFTEAIHHGASRPVEEAVLYCNVDDCIDAVVQDAQAAQSVKASVREIFQIPTLQPA